MCVKCTSLRHRLDQTKRAIAIGLDKPTAARIADYAQKLESELAAIREAPGHEE